MCPTVVHMTLLYSWYKDLDRYLASVPIKVHIYEEYFLSFLTHASVLNWKKKTLYRWARGKLAHKFVNYKSKNI